MPILFAINRAKNQAFPRRLRFALPGIRQALRRESSLRLPALALIGMRVVLALAHLEPIWWALVGLVSAGVLAAELFNTAIEHLADHLHPEMHPSIRLVKDCAAAAVLRMACGAVGIAIAVRGRLCAAVTDPTTAGRSQPPAYRPHAGPARHRA